MALDILIAAEFLDDISAPNTYNSRFFTIADMLVERGHSVRFVTTDFVHSAKRHVTGVTKYKQIPLAALHEPGYRKNISLSRFRSHYRLSRALRKWLRTTKKPDVIYCAVPSLDFAYEAARYARDNGVKFVVDIQDLWPEAFQMVLDVPGLSDLLFYPLRRKADTVYRTADRICAVSQTYVDRALKVSEKCTTGDAVFLGTDVDRFDRFRQEPSPLQKKEGEVWLGYVGTLGYSYDLKTVMDAMDLLRDLPEAAKLRFVVAGDGPLRQEFEDYAAEKKVDVVFTGKLPYPQMVALLCQCDMAVNPIKKRAAQSIINKHGDYAAAGIPVVNSQEAMEYRHLVRDRQMGFNCRCQDPQDMADKLLDLLTDPGLRETMGRNARICAEEKFHRGRTYRTIIDAIEGQEDTPCLRP